MALMRGELKNCVVKNMGYAHFDAAGTHTARPINLTELTSPTATAQKFTWCKLVWVGEKTGGGNIGSAAITPLTGTSNTCATEMAAYPVSVPVVDATGADRSHGYCYAAGTGTTGRFSEMYDIDLLNSQVRTWLGCTVAVTVTSTDDVDAIILAVMGGARELPATGHSVNTML